MNALEAWEATKKARYIIPQGIRDSIRLAAGKGRCGVTCSCTSWAPSAVKSFAKLLQTEGYNTAITNELNLYISWEQEEAPRNGPYR